MALWIIGMVLIGVALLIAAIAMGGMLTNMKSAMKKVEKDIDNFDSTSMFKRHVNWICVYLLAALVGLSGVICIIVNICQKFLGT